MQNVNETAKLKLYEIGQEIRARRKTLGWSQERLSEEAAVSVDSVKRVEAGTNTWAESVMQILVALGIATATDAAPAPDSQQIKAEIHRLVDML